MNFNTGKDKDIRTGEKKQRAKGTDNNEHKQTRGGNDGLSISRYDKGDKQNTTDQQTADRQGEGNGEDQQ